MSGRPVCLHVERRRVEVAPAFIIHIFLKNLTQYNSNDDILLEVYETHLAKSPNKQGKV